MKRQAVERPEMPPFQIMRGRLLSENPNCKELKQGAHSLKV